MMQYSCDSIQACSIYLFADSCIKLPTKPIIAAATKLGMPLPKNIARRLRGKNNVTLPAGGRERVHECFMR